MHPRSLNITEVFDHEYVPAPAEISNEMDKLPPTEDTVYLDDASEQCPEGCIMEGVSTTRAMRNPRRAHNNMW